MPHGINLQKTEKYTSIEKYSPFHMKNMLYLTVNVFLCCSKCTSLVVPNLDPTSAATNTYSTIWFNVYILVSHCTVNFKETFEEIIIFFCVQSLLKQ